MGLFEWCLPSNTSAYNIFYGGRFPNNSQLGAQLIRSQTSRIDTQKRLGSPKNGLPEPFRATRHNQAATYSYDGRPDMPLRVAVSTRTFGNPPQS
jgi:hypothetical protein